jgi:hypothetical protein
MKPLPKSRPIIFSSRMVNALLAGTKTQTRRTIKPQPDLILNQTPYLRNIDIPHALIHMHCPYGAIGDTLWVKESWCHDAYPRAVKNAKHFIYKADEEATNPSTNKKWITPLFMPRIASRITLEIIEVRAERLNDCSTSDAISEGVDVESSGLDTLASFKALWESINGAGSWMENPWVWVVEFRRL